MLAVESGMLKVGALYIMGRLLLGALILFSKGTIQAGVLTHKSMMLLRISKGLYFTLLASRPPCPRAEYKTTVIQLLAS